MSQFKFFYDDWLDIDDLYDRPDPKLVVNLSVNFFKNLRFDSESLKSYRIEAAKECNKMLGTNPALCLSGGIDSQAMVSCWKEANLDFDTYTLVFEDDLNIQDVESARKFCANMGIKLHEIRIDIIKFLARENFDMGMKYKIPSPHFTTHYKMYELLHKKGYTGICAGGFAPAKQDGVWSKNGYNVFNYILFSKLSNIKIINFLNFYPKLAWAICLLTPRLYDTTIKHNNTINWELELNKYRYEEKVQSYLAAGIHIEPQATKYTGFELVKNYYKEQTGDGWTFEKRFREPLARIINPFDPLKYLLSEEQESVINSIYNNNISAGLTASTRI